MEPETDQPIDRSTTNKFQPPKKSKKKTILIAVLVLLLVVGVGAGAWWYGKDQAQKKADEQMSALQSRIDDLERQVSATVLEEESTTTEDSEKGHLVIREWDIKIRADDPTIKYQINSADRDRLLLYTDSSKLVGEKCFPEYNAIFGLDVIRSSRRLVGDEAVYLTYLREIGGNHYYIGFPDGGCGTASEMDNFNSAADALRAIGETLSRV